MTSFLKNCLGGQAPNNKILAFLISEKSDVHAAV